MTMEALPAAVVCEYTEVSWRKRRRRTEDQRAAARERGCRVEAESRYPGMVGFVGKEGSKFYQVNTLSRDAFSSAIHFFYFNSTVNRGRGMRKRAASPSLLESVIQELTGSVVAYSMTPSEPARLGENEAAPTNHAPATRLPDARSHQQRRCRRRRARRPPHPRRAGKPANIPNPVLPS